MNARIEATKQLKGHYHKEARYPGQFLPKYRAWQIMSQALPIQSQ